MEPSRDYSALIETLGTSGDIELQKIARAARSFFLSPHNAPHRIDLDELAHDVETYFPTPFANTFATWRSVLRAEYLSADRSDADLLAARFTASFNGMWTCWRQIVHFLPFVFLAPLSRLSDDLQKTAGKRLARAFVDYDAFYRLPDDAQESDRKKFEGQQSDLLENLIEICVDVGSASPPPAPFFFGAALLEQRTFRTLFPTRFAIELKFIQSTRNRFHGNVGARAAEMLQTVYGLVEPVFLDMVSIMAPLSRAYGLYYVEQVDETASTASFSGRHSSPARFNLAVGGPGRSSNEAFLPNHVYLIDRRRELARDPIAPPLEPRDYADLTPFIIERGRLEGPGPVALERRIYALDEYRATDRSQFVSFMDLAGRALRRLPFAAAPTDYERRELSDLLGEIERFSNIVEKLDDYIRLRRRTGVDFPAIRQSVWKLVSKRQLESVVNTHTVAYDGESVPATGEVALCSYDPELYVAPRESADVTAFFETNKRGLLLIGGSGLGKTTLLASCFLERLRAGDIAVFLSGRWLSKASLGAILTDVTSIMGQNWTPVDLETFVADENAARQRERVPRPPTQVSIFIDAVNEYTVDAGAPRLLEEIIEFVNTRGRKPFGCELKNVRLVATCRTETWLGYRDSAQNILDADSFHCAPGGEPITVAGFEDERARRLLYENYRQRYGLSSTPYEKLAPAVAELFRSPLMLALIAETYGTTVRGETGQKVPRDLNYYAVFSNLRRRKLTDCRYLVPNRERRETMEIEIGECLATFAKLLYERLTAPAEPRDYVGIEQTTRSPMKDFTAARDDRQVTAFRALREVGLVTSKGVAETDDDRNEGRGRAYTFFHDRYAEYELARVYQASALGKLTNDVNRDQSALGAIAGTIERLMQRATAFPVLSGAIEHWFQMNLNRGSVAALVPLCDRLSLSESGSVRGKTSDVLTAFVLRGSVRANDLYRTMFASCGPSLRVDLATALGESWPGVSVDVVRDFIEACNPARDEIVLETLADVFAEHANGERQDADGTSSVAFVARVCPDFLGLVGLAADPNRLKDHLKFLLRFCLMTIVTCAKRPHILSELRAFLVERFRVLVAFVVGKQVGNVFVDWPAAKLRDFLREQFERSMYGAWDDGISCNGVNDTFFVSDGGSVQRDVLLEYVPYLCAVHNQEFAALSLEDESPFLQSSLEMLNYRKYSILGFAAYVSVTMAIRDDHAALRRIVLKLMTEGTEAGRFVAINLVEAYTIVHPGFAGTALSIVAEDMLPRLPDEGDALPHLIFCAAGAVETNIDANWDGFVPILDTAFDRLAQRGDQAEMVAFAKELRCMTFFGDSRIGTRFVDYLLRARYLDDGSPWRAATLEICAGMLAGHRSDLLNLFAQYGIPDEALREAEVLRDQEVLDQQRTFGARARWNLFFVRSLANDTKLRYLLMKYMFCSIALCNNVEQWATQMGTFMIEAIRAYTAEDDDPGRYERLTIDDVYAVTPMRPVPGGGKKYEPRRRASAK
jgi:hypothetical protein